MKLLVLALVTRTAFGGGMLGIGLDVLPAVYTFAASRIDAAPDLRLKSCNETSCRWTTEHGVELVAYVSGFDLDIRRIEVSARIEDRAWFEKACQTLVAITLSKADGAEKRAVAASITHAAARRAERELDGIRFYGVTDGEGPSAIQRCGAAQRNG